MRWKYSVDACRFCGSLENLHKSCKKGNGYQYYECRKCGTARAKKYRESKSGKMAASKARDKYESKNPIKVRSWWIARKLPPKSCEVCGIIKSDKHHPDSSKPLEIIYLCRLHHKQIHKTLLTNV